MTVVEWKAVFDLIKVVLECVAIVGAGVWATYIFGSLRQIARARSDIAKIEAEHRKTEAEIDRLTEQARVGAVIQMSLEAMPEIVPNDPLLYVSAAVENRERRKSQRSR
jgi:cell division protein FtsB